jgi:DNA-binding winged helix-turn-helix (wHTH) protein/tetratricopeptide (TPR) repeat protein
MATSTSSKRVRFGVFEVDLRSGELHKHGVKIKLHHQPFQVLTMLLEHPGEVVTREELKSKLWPFDTFVDSDVGLNSAVKKLRDALGDSAEIPHYVETLSRRGYRFIGSLGDASSSGGEHAPGVPGRVVVEQSAAASEGVVTEVPAVSGVSRRWTLWTTAGVLAGLLVLLVGFDVGSWREKLLPRATPIHERSPGDVVILQSEVARAIANAIQVQLTPQEQARLTRVQSVDPQAYESYLKGRYFWNKRTDVAVRKSIDYFQQAIQRDPNYALAYAGMAEAYIVRGDVSPEERFSKAKATAKIALQMDDGLAEAHNAMAMSLFCYDWDWASAEREFQRAIALNPNYAMAHQWYGQFQKAMGRREWVAEVKRAHELDPLSLVIAGAGQYLTSGQYDQAIENTRKKLELDPEFALAYLQLGQTYERKGMYEDAIAQFQKGLDLSGGEPAYLAALGYVYGLSGKRAEAMNVLTQLASLSKHRYVSPYDIALIHVALGEKDSAFDWLEKALTARSYELVYLRLDKRMETMRSDPRYSKLVRQIGLPQ